MCCVDVWSSSHGTQNLAEVEGQLEAENEGQDVTAEDSLSSDEYDCASPDDISLPPLAETPESMAVQSDFEESHCFSPHGIDSKQQSHHHPQDTSNEPCRQHEALSQAKSCQAVVSGPQPSTRSGYRVLFSS